MNRFCLCSLAVVVGVALSARPGRGAAQPPDPALAPPHASWHALSFANGVGAAYYDTRTRKLAGFWPHVYAERAPGEFTPNLLYDAYPGLRNAGQSTWLTAAPITHAGYDAGRGIATVRQRVGDIEVTQHLFAPFAPTLAATTAVVTVRNAGPTALTDAALFWLVNAHLGSGAGGVGAEQVQWFNGAYEERGARGILRAQAWPTPNAHTVSPQNPYGLVTGNQRFPQIDDSGLRDDAVFGYEWDLAGLAPGATRTFSITLGVAPDGDAARVRSELARLATDPARVLTDEQTQWDAYLARAVLPGSLTDDERAVARLALAVLRMGQIRSVDAADANGDGAIVASLPPGMWNIAWVRDQAYAVQALIDAQLWPEARAALAFWWRDAPGRGQWVCCDRDGLPWVGHPYHLSVVRYLGNGAEQSDENHRGPNIEFDGFGLALSATAAYVAGSGDAAFVDAYREAMFTKTADVLLALRETEGPNQGLIRADSSIWETHWYDGGKQHTTYTQATAVAGLRAAAALAGLRSDAAALAQAERYRKGADGLAQAIATRLVDGSGIVKSHVTDQAYLDLAAVMVFLNDIVAPQSPVFASTYRAWQQGLRIRETGRGYRRNDDGGAYDEREWVVVDLWLAQALWRAGYQADGDALLAWVTAQARHNYDVVPENYHRLTADYEGEVPMLGFGAGAYVSALWARHRGATPQPEVPGGGDGTPQATTPGGCCQTAQVTPPWAAGLCWWLGTMLLRRSRRSRSYGAARRRRLRPQ